MAVRSLVSVKRSGKFTLSGLELSVIPDPGVMYCVPDTEGALETTEINRMEPFLVYFLVGLESCRFWVASERKFHVRPIDGQYKILLVFLFGTHSLSLCRWIPSFSSFFSF